MKMLKATGWPGHGIILINFILVTFGIKQNLCIVILATEKIIKHYNYALVKF